MRTSLLLFILLSNNALSSDWGKWRKDDICTVTWEFINNTKQELLDRSEAVEKYTGAKVDIEFLHNANMDRKQQALHNKFLNFKTNEKDFHKYIVPYLVELEKNRALLATAEEKAAKIWEERNKKGEIKEYVTREAELYGTQIKSKRIGVVLDNSTAWPWYFQNFVIKSNQNLNMHTSLRFTVHSLNTLGKNSKKRHGFMYPQNQAKILF